MSVETYIPAAPLLISGRGPYPFSLRIDPGDALNILIENPETGHITIPWTTAYVLTRNADQVNAPGGSVMFTEVSAAYHAGSTLHFVRVVPLEQGWDGFTARDEGLVLQLDRMVRTIQDESHRARTALRFFGPIAPVAVPPLATPLVGDGIGGLKPGPDLDAMTRRIDGLQSPAEVDVIAAMTDLLAGVTFLRQTEGDFLPALSADDGALSMSVTYADRWARWTRIGNLIQGVGYMRITALARNTAGGKVRIDMSAMGVPAGLRGGHGAILEKSHHVVLPTFDGPKDPSIVTVVIPPGGVWGLIEAGSSTSSTTGTVFISQILQDEITPAAPMILRWSWTSHL